MKCLLALKGQMALFGFVLLIPQMSMAATCSVRNPERFTDFLPTFSDSKGFALQRTVLPLPLLNWTAPGMDTEGRPLSGPHKVYLSAGEYGRWPSLNRYMQDNELLAEVRSQSKTEAVVEIYKEGNDGHVTFHFKTKGGCWHLWQYEVRS
jgi:hypothetical protein